MHAAVEPDGGRPVEVLEAAELLKAGLAQPELEAPVVAAAHLVDEQELEEVSVVELVPTGEGDALGQGRGARAPARTRVIIRTRGSIESRSLDIPPTRQEYRHEGRPPRDPELPRHQVA